MSSTCFPFFALLIVPHMAKQFRPEKHAPGPVEVNKRNHQKRLPPSTVTMSTLPSSTLALGQNGILSPMCTVTWPWSITILLSSSTSPSVDNHKHGHRAEQQQTAFMLECRVRTHTTRDSTHRQRLSSREDAEGSKYCTMQHSCTAKAIPISTNKRNTA